MLIWVVAKGQFQLNDMALPVACFQSHLSQRQSEYSENTMEKATQCPHSNKVIGSCRRAHRQTNIMPSTALS